MWNFKVSWIQPLTQNLKVTCTLKIESSQLGKNKTLMIFYEPHGFSNFWLIFNQSPQVLYDCCLFCHYNLITGCKICENQSSRFKIRKIVYNEKESILIPTQDKNRPSADFCPSWFINFALPKNLCTYQVVSNIT